MPRVVIADDEADVRAWARAALVDAGISVVGEADNGRDAINLAVQLRPDVVLMDIVMGELDGIAATRIITARTPEVRVVLLTASADPEFDFLGRRAGARHRLIKGLPVSELVATVLDAVSVEPAAVSSVAL